MTTNGKGPDIEVAPVPHEWADDNPFFLYILRPTGENVKIDLGEYQWMAIYADWMRGEARWLLIRKDPESIVLVVNAADGDQPYYTARHIGVAGSGGGNEIKVYGIGAKRANGGTDRMWVMPDGVVVSGDDCDALGMQYLYALGPKPIE